MFKNRKKMADGGTVGPLINQRTPDETRKTMASRLGGQKMADGGIVDKGKTMGKSGMSFAKAIQMDKRRKMFAGGMPEDEQYNYDEWHNMKHHDTSGEPGTNDFLDEKQPMKYMADGGMVDDENVMEKRKLGGSDDFSSKKKFGFSEGGIAGSEHNQEKIDEHHDESDIFEKPMDEEEDANFAHGGMVAKSNFEPTGAEYEESGVDTKQKDEKKFGGKNMGMALAMHLKKKMRGY